MKHSKFLNAGIVANTAERIIISKISKDDKKSISEIRKYISVLKSVPNIQKELSIFDQLTNTFVERKALGSKLISEIKKDIAKIDFKKLNKERQIFFNKVKEIFPELKNNLSQHLKEYKLYASIKNFIDDSIEKKLNAKERLIIEENIIEALCNGNQAKNNAKLIAETNEIPQGADSLTVSLMIRDFCSKWKKTLSPTQYKYLIEYTSNGNVINESWESNLKKDLSKFDLNKIKDANILEKTENTISEIKNKTSFSNEEILEYAELFDTLNEIK